MCKNNCCGNVFEKTNCPCAQKALKKILIQAGHNCEYCLVDLTPANKEPLLAKCCKDCAEKLRDWC